jgi:hypothetical protein
MNLFVVNLHIVFWVNEHGIYTSPDVIPLFVEMYVYKTIQTYLCMFKLVFCLAIALVSIYMAVY